MTEEEKIICKQFLNDADKTHSCNEYKLLMALLEQEPTTKNDLGVDCISRQATINAIRRIHPVDTDYDCTLYDKIDVMYVLDEMPSVTPQEPKPMVEIDLYSVIKQKYIEREVLDKIRAEIVDLGQRTMNDNRASGIWACRDIIDKYKGESEG